MYEKRRPELPRQVLYFLRFALGFGALGVGFTWYDANHAPKPVGTISWERVLLAMACAGIAEGCFYTILWLRNRAR